MQDDEEPGIAASEMKAGSVYCLIYPGGGITSDFLVRKVESGKNGLKDFIISEAGWDTDGRALVLNPETSDELCESAGVINDKYRAIKLKAPTKTDNGPSCSSGGHKYPNVSWSVTKAQLGDPATVNAWLFGTLKLKKASVQHDPIEDVYQIRIAPGGNVLTMNETMRERSKRAFVDPEIWGRVLEDSGLVSPWSSRCDIATKLASCMYLHASAAEKWLDAAVDAKGHAVSHVVEYPDEIDEILGVHRDFARDREKQASLMPLQNNPPYELQGDPVHRLPVEYGPQTHILNAQYTRPPDATRMQLGEVYDPARGVENADGDDFIFHMQPEELAQMSVLKKMPHVLDHGVIGSMASMYDASSAMDPLLNDMERGLDATGRAIFLMLWKPIDFRNMYGADDMPDLENKLTSIFKGLGDLLLDLLKKNNSNDPGSPPVM